MNFDKKARLFYLLSLVCFLLIISFTVITAVNVDMLIDKNNEADSSGQEIGAAIGYALTLGIMMVLLLLYGIAAAVPTLYKIVALIVNGYATGIISIILDVIFAGASTVFSVTALINAGGKIDFTLVWMIGCSVLAIASLVFDVLAVRAKRDARIEKAASGKADVTDGAEEALAES